MSDRIYNPSRTEQKARARMKSRRFTFVIDDKHEEAYWILYQMQKMHGRDFNDELCHIIIDHFFKKGGLPAVPRLHQYFRCKKKSIGEMYSRNEITSQELADIYLGAEEIITEISSNKELTKVVQDKIFTKKQT